MRRVLAVFLATLLASQAGAQTLPQVQESGVRGMASTTEARIWRAVGRLDTGVSFCSATLIAPDLVLTAAHCVFNPETSERLAAEDLTFLAGLNNGRAEAIRQVRRTIVLPGYRHEQGPELAMIGRDLALLELRQPVSAASILPIPVGQPRRREGEVTVVSYGEDREAFASIEEGCEVLARQDAVRSLTCEVVQGASGSPVLRMTQGQPEVIAVMSASGHADGEDISLAVMLEDHMNTLMDAYEATGPTATFGTAAGTTRFITPSQNTRDGLGARFIRP